MCYVWSTWSWCRVLRSIIGFQYPLVTPWLNGSLEMVCEGSQIILRVRPAFSDNFWTFCHHHVCPMFSTMTAILCAPTIHESSLLPIERGPGRWWGVDKDLRLKMWPGIETIALSPPTQSWFWWCFLFHTPLLSLLSITAAPMHIYRVYLSRENWCFFATYRINRTRGCVSGSCVVLHHLFFYYSKRTKFNKMVKPKHGGDRYDAGGVRSRLILRASGMVEAGGWMQMTIRHFRTTLLFMVTATKTQKWGPTPTKKCQIASYVPLV